MAVPVSCINADLTFRYSNNSIGWTLHAKYKCVKCCIYALSFTVLTTLCRWVLLLPTLYSWGNWDRKTIWLTPSCRICKVQNWIWILWPVCKIGAFIQLLHSFMIYFFTFTNYSLIRAIMLRFLFLILRIWLAKIKIYKIFNI